MISILYELYCENVSKNEGGQQDGIKGERYRGHVRSSQDQVNKKKSIKAGKKKA